MKVRFDEFVLDSEARQLSRAGVDLHLSPKAFDLLSILVAQRPGVINKDALRAALWGTTNVVDANLNNLVSEIRSALGDDSQKPKYLRTVHRIGYAFCGTATDDGEVARPSGEPPHGWLVWNDRSLALRQGANLIGRDPASAVWIDAPGVSRKHASIRLDGTTATIEDLNSTNGTFVDKRRVRQITPLEDGTSVTIGDATLTYRAQSSAGAPTKKIRRK